MPGGAIDMRDENCKTTEDPFLGRHQREREQEAQCKQSTASSGLNAGCGVASASASARCILRNMIQNHYRAIQRLEALSNALPSVLSPEADDALVYVLLSDRP